MRIIQISGKGRVGKTTLAHLIANRSLDLGYIPVIIPFANAIKQLAEKKGLNKDNGSDAYREFCQKLGAEKRLEDPEYWVVKAYEEIQSYMIKEIDNKRLNKDNYEYLIIQDDVRYMNELAFGRDLVATQIFVNSAGRKLKEHDAEWRTHESEILGNVVEESLGKSNNEYVELFDCIIDNDGTLEELKKIVDHSIQDWLELGYLELEEYNDPTDNSNS